MTKLKQFLEENQSLTHSKMKKVISHVQRRSAQWVLNTLLIEGSDVPFKYKRQKIYRSLKGARVDIIYYPAQEEVAGIAFEYMKVVKVARS